MATQLCGPSETTPTIGVVPYSTTVARQPERFDLQHHSSSTSSIPTKLGKRGVLFPSSALERAIAKEFGLKLVHRLLRRSRIDCATGPGRYDGIFSEHVENEGEVRRQTKKDISQPASLPPVLDVKNPGGRQSGWKKRFVELKSKHAICLPGKRTSLKTWLSQSGKGGSEVYNTKVDSSDTVHESSAEEEVIQLPHLEMECQISDRQLGDAESAKSARNVPFISIISLRRQHQYSPI